MPGDDTGMETTPTTETTLEAHEQIATLAQKREAAWISLGGGTSEMQDYALRPYFDSTWNIAESLITSPLTVPQAFTDPMATETLAHRKIGGMDPLLKLTIAWAKEESGVRNYFEKRSITKAAALVESGTREQLIESIAELTAAIEARQLLEVR
jgi:hypothetical protein